MRRPVIYCRIDLRTLATLGLFWNKQGLLPPNKALSELVHASLTQLQLQILGKYPQMDVETVEEAIKHLRVMGFKLPVQDQSARSLFKTLQEEAMLKEGMEPMETQIKGVRKENDDEDVWEEGMNGPSNEKFAEKEKIKLEKLKKAQDEAVQTAIDSGMIREPNDNSTSTSGNKSPKTK